MANQLNVTESFSSQDEVIGNNEDPNMISENSSTVRDSAMIRFVKNVERSRDEAVNQEIYSSEQELRHQDIEEDIVLPDENKKRTDSISRNDTQENQSEDIEQMVMEASSDFDEMFLGASLNDRITSFKSNVENVNEPRGNQNTKPPVSTSTHLNKSDWELSTPKRWNVFEYDDEKMSEDSKKASEKAISQALEVAARQEMIKHLSVEKIEKEDSLILNLIVDESEDYSSIPPPMESHSLLHSSSKKREKPWRSEEIEDEDKDYDKTTKAPGWLSLIPSPSISVSKNTASMTTPLQSSTEIQNKVNDKSPPRYDDIRIEAMRMINSDVLGNFSTKNDVNEVHPYCLNNSFTIDEEYAGNVNINATIVLSGSDDDENDPVNEGNKWSLRYNTKSPSFLSDIASGNMSLRDWYTKVDSGEAKQKSQIPSPQEIFQKLKLTDVRLSPDLELKYYQDESLLVKQLHQSMRKRAFCSLAFLFFVVTVSIAAGLTMKNRDVPLDDFSKQDLYTADDVSQLSRDLSSLTFFAIADTYFSSEQKEKLVDDISHFPTDAEFGVHVGGAIAPVSQCIESIYFDFREILELSPVPLLAVPGDEDWSECPNPEDALELWRSSLGNLGEPSRSQSHKKKVFVPVMRQSDRPENFALVTKNVLVLGLNVIGKYERHRVTEQEAHDDDNLAWIRFNLELQRGSVNAVIVLGHTIPSVSQYEGFFRHVINDFKHDGVSIPILYVHGGIPKDEEQHKIYSPYPELNMSLKAAFVKLEETSSPVKIVVNGNNDNLEMFTLERGQR